MERFWGAKEYGRMLSECLRTRSEAPILRLGDLSGAPAAAAMGIIRLDELSQPQSPLYRRLVHAVLASQQADGGWGDVMVTALCLRALLCGGGDGIAIQRGLAYLVALQQLEGTWPRVPLRRFPADPAVSAYVVSQLADQPLAIESLRLADTMRWLEEHQADLSPETQRLWRSTSTRFGRSLMAGSN
jgi:hypothetical protein